MKGAAMAYEQAGGAGFAAPRIARLAGRVFTRGARFVGAVLAELARIPQYQEDAERLRQGLRRQGRDRA